MSFIIATISDLAGIPLTEYDGAGRIKNIYSSISDQKEPHPQIAEYISRLREDLRAQEFSIRYLDGLPICICGSRVEESYYVWGPIAFRYLNQLEKKRYNQLIKNKTEEIRELYFCSMQRLMSVIAVLLTVMKGKEYTLDYFMDYIDQGITEFPNIAEQLIEHTLKREDNLLLNHTYAEEQVAMDAIRYGDTEKVKQYMKMPSYKSPLIIEDNVFKNDEYMAISFITMAARAAIEGGATSAESFLVSDVYLKRISKCRTSADIKKNVDEASIVFAELVKKYAEHRSSNSHVEDSKKYIAQNIFKKISLSDVAKALQVNASYLSKLFSRTEGMTISEYIQREKVNLAKNMLKFSDRSVYEISEYLNMSSHSYLTSTFKKYVGLTPQEYRAKNHPPEF
ncbi:MAG TPA: helix-turn-helix transcriptional regulator [Clostridiales bacterium]|nr:helix-turn-helix transcriptional regulator [Clostridiales bacterium]